MLIMGSFILVQVLAFLSLLIFPNIAFAELKQNYYANICPDVETIVRNAVAAKVKLQPKTIPGTLRLFFHDCFVLRCDASIMIQSSGSNTAEKDHQDNLSLAGDGFDMVNKAKAAVDAVPSCRNKVSCADILTAEKDHQDNLSLAGDGFDMVNKAKAAVDAVPSCRNKVSCADILTMATRDVIKMAGGPSYSVELGRLDGLSSTADSVDGQLPIPNWNLDQLNDMFVANNLTQVDMIALSGAHTLGFSHCDQFANRIYNFSKQNPVDPTLNKSYATQLQQLCPKNVSPQVAIHMDPNTPTTFDNMYFKNLQQGQGLFTSDQVLYTDTRSKQTVISLANDPKAFSDAFIEAMTKLGQVGVKTGQNGNIRQDCSAFN